jgi:hypothetical protein
MAMNPRTLVVLALLSASAGCKSSTREATPAPTAPAPTAPAVVRPAAPAEAHGDHHARHGGIVMMDGNQQHFEILLGETDGRHQVYFSSGGRQPLAASVMEQVQLTVTRPDGTVEDLAMQRDTTDARWETTGRPLTSPETRIKVAYQGKTFPAYQVELTLAGLRASAMPAPTAPTTPTAPPKDDHSGHRH